MVRPRVLVTGFGPFPGVAENPSAWLAETLADRLVPRGFDLHYAVLPTEWKAVAGLAPRLHAEHRPQLMVHFGVSLRAKGLHLERAAHNGTVRRPDACGAHPPRPTVSATGPHTLETRLPVVAVAAQLRALGHDVRVSNCCGRYLCNDLYYRSLTWTEAEGGHALFVHVPHPRAKGGDVMEDSSLRAAEATLRLAVQAAGLPARMNRKGTRNPAKTRQGELA